MRRRLAPFGIGFTVDADDARVLAALALALARYPSRAGGRGELQLSVRTGTDAAADPAWPHTTVTFDGEGLELRCGSGRLSAWVGEARAEAVLPPSLLAIEDAVRMVVEGAFSALAINGGLLHAMHAGLVGHQRRGLVLRGASGAGKSTLTYALLRAGSTVASDDWTYAVPGDAQKGGGLRLWGYPWRLFLVPEAVARFPELAGVAAVLHPGADRLKVPVVPPVSRRRRSLPVDAVVFLDPDPVLDLQPIDVTEARQRFWDCALPTERTGLPEAWVEALLQRPTYRLNRGRDPDAAARLLQQAVATFP
ncbi:MAG: hypothetical protein ACKV2O_05710 [Acidimicrobiales bacterium]